MNKEKEKIYQYALKLLAFCLRSEKEIYDKLIKKFEKTLVEQTIRRLKKANLINDEAFVRAFIKTREILKPKGKKALFLELRQKGIDKALINQILENEYNEEKELFLAKKAAESRIKRYKDLPRDKFEQKIVGFLLRRGFSWGTVRKIIVPTERRGSIGES